MKTKRKTKILSLILAITVVTTMIMAVPFTASAADSGASNGAVINNQHPEIALDYFAEAPATAVGSGAKMTFMKVDYANEKFLPDQTPGFDIEIKIDDTTGYVATDAAATTVNASNATANTLTGITPKSYIGPGKSTDYKADGKSYSGDNEFRNNTVTKDQIQGMRYVITPTVNGKIYVFDKMGSNKTLYMRDATENTLVQEKGDSYKSDGSNYDTYETPAYSNDPTKSETLYGEFSVIAGHTYEFCMNSGTGNGCRGFGFVTEKEPEYTGVVVAEKTTYSNGDHGLADIEIAPNEKYYKEYKDIFGNNFENAGKKKVHWLNSVDTYVQTDYTLVESGEYRIYVLVDYARPTNLFTLTDSDNGSIGIDGVTPNQSEAIGHDNKNDQDVYVYTYDHHLDAGKYKFKFHCSDNTSDFIAMAIAPVPKVNWTDSETDAGYYLSGDAHKGVIRFLQGFSAENVKECGFYITDSTGDIVNMLYTTSKTFEAATNDLKGIYADLKDIETNNQETYYMIAYVKLNDDETFYYSDVFGGSVDAEAWEREVVEPTDQ